MTAEESGPTYFEAFGPHDAPEVREQIRGDILNNFGIRLSDEELKWLSGRALAAATHRAFNAPTTGKSYKAVDDLRIAAKKLESAIRLVRTMATEPVVLGRDNLTHGFVEDYDVADDDDLEQQVDLSVHPTEDLLERLAIDAKRLARRAEYALNSASLAKKGTGRLIEGYSEFIAACWQVWRIHRADKGWSRKGGRGSGPFVQFVHIAQELLPPGMRKESLGAVGDAVLSEMRQTK